MSRLSAVRTSGLQAGEDVKSDGTIAEEDQCLEAWASALSGACERHGIAALVVVLSAASPDEGGVDFDLVRPEALRAKPLPDGSFQFADDISALPEDVLAFAHEHPRVAELLCQRWDPVQWDTFFSTSCEAFSMVGAVHQISFPARTSGSASGVGFLMEADIAHSARYRERQLSQRLAVDGRERRRERL